MPQPPLSPPHRTPTSAPHAEGFRLRISELRALRGPNLWRLAPAIVCRLRVEGSDPGLWPTLPPRLRQLAQSLKAAGVNPPLVQRLADSMEATPRWPQLVADLALVLQSAAADEESERPRWTQIREADHPDEWDIATEYEVEDVGLESIESAADLLEDCVRDRALRLERTLGRLRAHHHRVRLGPRTTSLIDEARRRGIPVRRAPGESTVLLGQGSRLRRIDTAITDSARATANDMVATRERTRATLARLGVPMPRGGVARDVEEALDIARDIGYPVVLKPLAVDRAGIALRLDDPAAVKAAFPDTDSGDASIEVEQYVVGHDHHLTILDGEIVAVIERPSGGATSIGEAADNASGDRTRVIHPDNVALCVFAADVMGLTAATIDVRTPDIAVPFRENGAMIVDITASHDDHAEQPSEAALGDLEPEAVLDGLFPPGAESRIPVVVVTGTNGKTTTTRLIAHLLRQRGHHVGFTTTDGVYYDDRVLMEGDMTGPMAADMILSNPRVDAAVLETARGGILRAGLGFEQCDVAVVLNVTADHLGLRGINTVEQLAHVKSVIVAVVKSDGCAVLNADDPLVYAMRERTQARVALFTLLSLAEQPLVGAHVAAGGSAVTIEDDAVVVHDGASSTALISVTEIPLTLGGAARFQVQNVAAAVAAAVAAGVTLDAIRAGLRVFGSSVARTPGRMNAIQMGGATVVIDYAHNAGAISALFDYASRTSATRRIAVLAVPGDRRDEDIRAVGALASALDVVVLKEHSKYRRGREPGAIADLMREGFLRAGGDPTRVSVVLEEQDAVAAVKALLRPGDLALFIADDGPAALKAFETTSAAPSSSS